MKDKIKNFINNPLEVLGIQHDKFLHFLFSFLISLLLGLELNGSFLALVLTIIIGIGKEIYDVAIKNLTKFDINDLAFDSLGGFFGYSIALLISLI